MLILLIWLQRMQWKKYSSVCNHSIIFLQGKNYDSIILHFKQLKRISPSRKDSGYQPLLTKLISDQFVGCCHHFTHLRDYDRCISATRCMCGYMCLCVCLLYRKRKVLSHWGNVSLASVRLRFGGLRCIDFSNPQDIDWNVSSGSDDC